MSQNRRKTNEKSERNLVNIKTEDNYCPLEFIEFNNNQIIHFKLESKNGNELSKARTEWNEKLSESKHEFVNDN